MQPLTDFTLTCQKSAGGESAAKNRSTLEAVEPPIQLRTAMHCAVRSVYHRRGPARVCDAKVCAVGIADPPVTDVERLEGVLNAAARDTLRVCVELPQPAAASRPRIHSPALPKDHRCLSILVCDRQVCTIGCAELAESFFVQYLGAC